MAINTANIIGALYRGCVLPRPLFPSGFICFEPLPDKVDCVVFCSKNRRPILPCLPRQR